MGIFGNAFGWPHLIVILALVLLLFGAPKLPGLARSIGQSMRIFRGEMKTMKDENGKDVPVAEQTAAPAPGTSTEKTAEADSAGSGTSATPKP